MNIWQTIKDNIKDRDALFAVLVKDDGTNEPYTYGQMLQYVDVYADTLKGIGISDGDRVAIAAPSSPRWCFAYFAIMSLNAAPVLIDCTLPKTDLCATVERSYVSAVYTSPSYVDYSSEFEPAPTVDINDGKTFLNSCKTKPETAIGPDPAVGSIIYSSGTTKAASGIMHSHDAMYDSIMMYANIVNVTSKDMFLGLLPNSHIYGLYTQVLCAALTGASTAFTQSLRPACLTRTMSEFKPTMIPGVPMLYESLRTQIIRRINSDEKTKKQFEFFYPKCLALRKKTGINIGKYLFKKVGAAFGGRARILCAAGAPVSEQVAEFFYGVGFDFIIAYGATETNIPTIGNYGKVLTTDSCGRPFPGIECKIGENDEIMLRSPRFMLGYFNDEETTKAAYTDDGWFKTGDIGYFDDRGNIHISGRCKDNIVLPSGKKVVPADVEANYTDIEGVEEFVVCGIPTGKGGICDEIHAFVKLSANASEEKVRTLISEISKKLSQNRKLAQLHFVDEIPKTALNKPKRYILKQQYLSQVKK